MDTRLTDFNARAKGGYDLPPTLPPVLNILVAGHRRERLEASKADLPAVREALEAAIGHIGAAADAAFAAPAYSREEAHKLRIVTGDETGTDTLADHIVSSRLDRFSLKHVPPLTVHHPVTEEPPPAWLVEYAVATRDEEAVGHADIIVVVWDGGAPQGFLGGTVRIVQRAALAGKPLLWIDMSGRCRLLDRTRLSAAVLLSLHTIETDPALLAGVFADSTWEDLEREVREILAPQALFEPGRKRHGGLQLVGAYFTPRRRSWGSRHAGSIDAFLTAVVSLDFQRARKAARRLVMTVEQAPWIGPALPSDMPPLLALEKFFIWSDTEAAIAAGKRRSSVWIIAICSFLAVFLSALGIAIGSAWPGGAFWIPIFEFVPLSATLVLFIIHRLQGVHQYWLFHRWVAEQLRFQRMVAPLDALHPALLRGVWSVPNTAEPASSPTGRHERLARLELQAQDWLLQRILAAEDFDLGNAKATTGELVPWFDEAVENVMAGIADQQRYHTGKATAFHHIHHHMDLLAVGAFAASGLAVLGHLVFGLEWTIVLTTALPTAGAAMTGIADQLEAARISGQSRASPGVKSGGCSKPAVSPRTPCA
jgi:hypothetical protein